jgi:hypothetical protein
MRISSNHSPTLAIDATSCRDISTRCSCVIASQIGVP